MRIYSAESCDARESLELGMAIGAWLGQNGMIMTGTDGKPVSRLVRRALTVGLASRGVTVLDMRMVPDMVVGYEVKRQGMGAGLYVSFDGARVHVDLVKGENEPVDEESVKKIRQAQAAATYELLGVQELGTVLYYPNGIEDYIDYLSSEIQFRKPISVLADCRTTPVAAIVPGLLERYGIKATLFNGLVSGYANPKPREEFLEALRRERFNLGLRFMDLIEIYDGEGNRLDERQGLKALLVYLKDHQLKDHRKEGGR
jgi:phosphomannomutase